MLTIVILVLLWIVAVSGGVAGLSVLLERMNPSNPFHMFLVAMSFLGLIAFAGFGLVLVITFLPIG